MRRLLASLCTAALLAALVSPVAAQPVLLGPGGLINTTTASVAVTNTVTPTSIYSYTIPAGFTQGGSAPLHLKLVGRMTTNQGVGAVGAANLGCNYGGATASIALVNGYTFAPSLVSQPFQIDLWLNIYGTQGKAINGWLQGRMETAVQNAVFTSLASSSVLNAATDVLTLSGTPNTLACTFVWGSAAATNSLVVTNGKLIVGD